MAWSQAGSRRTSDMTDPPVRRAPNSLNAFLSAQGGGLDQTISPTKGSPRLVVALGRPSVAFRDSLLECRAEGRWRHDRSTQLPGLHRVRPQHRLALSEIEGDEVLRFLTVPRTLVDSGREDDVDQLCNGGGV